MAKTLKSDKKQDVADANPTAKSEIIDVKDYTFKKRVQELWSHLTPLQVFFGVISVVSCIVIPMMFRDIYHEQSNQEVDNPFHYIPKITDFKLSFAFIVFFQVVRRCIRRVFYGFYDRHISDKYQGTVRQDKIHKCTTNVYKLLWFSLWSIYSYNYALKGAPHHSRRMGGEGNFKFAYIGLPYPALTAHM